jgi:protein gp37
MQKSRIEWTDYSINPVKGLCPMDCKDNQGKSYCYARRMYKRFHWNETPRVWLGAFDDLKKLKTPSRIFVGSTFELFHEICEQYDVVNWTLNTVKQYPQHTFIFLTKQPQNLIKYSPFPDNCWVGVSTPDWLKFSDALGYLAGIKSKVKFLSFEPLQERIEFDMLQKMLFPRVVSWVIIGQQTPIKSSTMPKLEWVKEIAESSNRANIPVFIKNNLNSCEISDYPELLDARGNLRQEFPNANLP